ncbi:MAG: hypothetical protein ACI350_02020 [Prevotella sp.]
MRPTNPHWQEGLRQLTARTMATLVCTFAVYALQAQDISQIGKGDPLIITGSIGTQNTYYHSSYGNGYMSPLSNTVYANLNISISGLSMPFSLYYSNDNMSFSYPQFSFNLTPRYKNFTAHIGRSSMPFSSYIMNMSFNGVGLEYRGKKFRTSAFYGILRSAVNDNPEDPNPRKPQYRRIGWGFSAGYGNRGSSIDLYLLRAYDAPGSIDEYWRRTYRPQENLVVGLKGMLRIKDFLSLSANMATSAFTADRESPKITTGEATRFDKIFDARYTSSVRYAGDASVNLSISRFNASVFYKIVQPDYTSLGTYYMSNNYHSLGVNFSTSLFRNFTLSASFSGQRDNLSNQQLYTTSGYVYSAMALYRISNNFNISAMYNGYMQTQTDGTAKVNDSTRVHRVLHSYSLMPSYSISGTNIDHTISLSANYTQNKDLSPMSIGLSDVETMAMGASYMVGVKPWEMDFTASVSHQQTKGFNSQYTSDVASISTGRGFLKDKSLNTTATMSMCYNHIRNVSKNLSMAFDLSASYTLKKVHSFSATASFSKYGDVNATKTTSSLDGTDIRLSLNYLYTFTLLEIKKKADKKL